MFECVNGWVAVSGSWENLTEKIVYLALSSSGVQIMLETTTAPFFFAFPVSTAGGNSEGIIDDAVMLSSQIWAGVPPLLSHQAVSVTKYLGPVTGTTFSLLSTKAKSLMVIPVALDDARKYIIYEAAQANEPYANPTPYTPPFKEAIPCPAPAPVPATSASKSKTNIYIAVAVVGAIVVVSLAVLTVYVVRRHYKKPPLGKPM